MLGDLINNSLTSLGLTDNRLAEFIHPRKYLKNSSL